MIAKSNLGSKRLFFYQQKLALAISPIDASANSQLERNCSNYCGIIVIFADCAQQHEFLQNQPAIGISKFSDAMGKDRWSLGVSSSHAQCSLFAKILLLEKPLLRENLKPDPTLNKLTGLILQITEVFLSASNFNQYESITQR
ncbi:MAG: hypothetical protein RMX96_31695 [Nostoc sp. ChiSLP02]|nr:hypothetical protein [Nostoc sp. DedSLP05]MDZ8100979.1 hypothetical protein [Nostoc sp. DedSLP01]MDZ8189388.1 hypothetical protein [Nostoc sp. ChiSLP02]